MNGFIGVHFEGITIKRDNVPAVFFRFMHVFNIIIAALVYCIVLRLINLVIICPKSSWEEISCLESSANIFTIFSQSRNINASCDMVIFEKLYDFLINFAFNLAEIPILLP